MVSLLSLKLDVVLNWSKGIKALIFPNKLNINVSKEFFLTVGNNK